MVEKEKELEKDYDNMVVKNLPVQKVQMQVQKAMQLCVNQQNY